MADELPDKMKLIELAERAGLPRRTIRYYISLGLLDGPERAGRGAVYTRRHLERLENIRQLRRRGLTLREIAAALDSESVPQDVPAPTPWWRYPVADDVIVWVKADAGPWRSRQIRRAIGRMASELKTRGKEADGESD